MDSTQSLKILFMQLTDTMIESREYREKHLEQEPLALSDKDKELSDQLRAQLNRIYQMDEGREIIEKCQLEALNKLDGFEKKLSQKKFSLYTI